MRRLVLIAPLVLAAAAEARGPGFDLVGMPPKATDSYLSGLSQNGSVAAGYSDIYQDPKYAPGYRWTKEGGRDDWGLLPEMPSYTLVSGINSDGSVLVGRMIDSPITKVNRAFRRIGDGPMENLGILPNEKRSFAASVSGDGQVVVGSCEHGEFSDAYGQAFRWDSQSGMKGLGYLKPNGSHSKAYGISRDGLTIVGMSQSGGIFGDVEAYRWTEAGGMEGLLGLPGAPYTENSARAVNADGSVIVGHGYGPDGFVHAVRWVDGVVEDLSPGINTAAYAYATDDAGDVAGGTYQGNTAFVWTPGTGLLDLDDYLTSFGVVVPDDYRLEDVYAISGDGLTFGGQARNLVTNQKEGFVATIPCPSAIMVLAPCLFWRRARGQPVAA